MRIEITQSIYVEASYLDVIAGGRVYAEDIGIGSDSFYEWDEVFEKYPSLECDKGFFLRIAIDNGFVENWPSGVKGYFEIVKVVDEGIYVLRDDKLNEIVNYEGYVPSCLEIERKGYGDYWEFNIDENGYIRNWKFSQKDVDEMLKKKD